jgi:hypothetical protein
MPVTGLEQVGPFRVSVYDKDFNFQFRLGDAAVTITPRHLAKGTGSLTIPLSHNRADYLLHRGRRVTIDYLAGKDLTTWTRVMSGPIWITQIPEGNTPAAGKQVQLGVEDDSRILWQMLAWSNPGSAIGSQTTNAYYTASGDCETVVKGLISANAGRFTPTLTVATNGHRGATVKVNTRFENVGDLVVALCQQGGLGFTVTQSGTGLVFDVYVPTDRTARVLTEESGTITSWSLNRVGFTASRAIVAGQGVGTARTFRQVSDTTGLEAAWGTAAEVFVDARDTADSTTQIQRGNQALADGQDQAGFAVTVAETDVVRAYKNLFVGDLVAVQITPTLAVTDYLSQMTLTWGDQGLVVQPQVGTGTSQASPDHVLAKAISSLARGIRYLKGVQ